ncbi:MAG: family 10 glycosylhydrolase [Candidatus Latescibacterota bacterium]
MSTKEIQNGRLICAFDCTREYPADEYFACGDVRVAESGAGRYREAEARPLSRFGYRFPIEHIGKPHVAVIRYPDDKRRYMCIMDGTCYDLSTGVFTDFAQPSSGGMEEIRQIFWPRWNDCSIVFMTWGKGEPAAVSEIEIYELDDLPALDVPGDPGDGSRREFGIQYEDPCGTGASEGAITHEEWEERVISYARHSGQKLFVYPINWYHGPQFPSEREPSDAFDVVVGRDRRQYSRWTTHPSDWLPGMLERFGREGLEFQGSLTLLRLGSLMQKMNVDLDAIKAGADTINNMLWCDQVQAGTQDWTPTYNSRNYTEALEFHAAGKDMRDFPWVYGEKTNQPYHPGPMFNPLHPVVQEAIVGLAGEMADRYGRFPAFKGISFNMWPPTILWFGSLHAGYDDYSIRLFEKETGIPVPVDSKAPDRFSKRYAFLMHSCRPAWIEWRCRKILQLFRKIRDAVVSARPDLRVTITYWNEITLGSGFTSQLHTRLNTGETCREAGLDVRLFRDEPGIEVDLQLTPSRDRAGGETLTDGAERPAEHVVMHRDHDFLDQNTLDTIRELPRSGVFIFNSWVEAWGVHKWFACEPDDTQARELAVMSGQPAEGIFRINSTYPEDGFWWDSQLRITPTFQGGVHFMEHHAHAVAELDACRITQGGLFLDKAHTGQIQRFARAYRALPKEKFETVGVSTDPVAVRTLVRDDRRYLYVVNRDFYPIEVEVIFSANPGEMVDLSTNEPLRPSERWRFVLGPYELRSCTVASGVGVAGFTAVPPKDMLDRLRAEGHEALVLIEAVRAAGKELPGMDAIASGMRSALEEGRLAWLRRAINGYVVLRCRELAESIS